MSRQRSSMLTEYEELVMAVLWDSEKGITIAEIAERMRPVKAGATIHSVSQVIKRLLERELIRVDEHVMVSNVYARTFVPLVSREEYLRTELERLERLVSVNRFVGRLGVFQAFLGTLGGEKLDQSQIRELDELLEKSKRRLHGEENEK